MDREKKFNYEGFYDFYSEIRSGILDKDVLTLCTEFRNNYHVSTKNVDLISSVGNILNQVIGMFLVDGNGRKFYGATHISKPTYIGYTGFLNCMEKFGELGVTHIHTLNHDMLMESLSRSDWMAGSLSDGFEELGSKYFGEIEGGDKIRLLYFCDSYKGRFRLYKLHGSIDQFPFHLKNGMVDTYVKVETRVNLTKLYKEVNNGENGLSYENDWINYHPDFLSGTTSKILRYLEPKYYAKVFSRFKENLSNSNRLVVIGYGCGDEGINRLIEKHFNFKSCPIIVVDPKPNPKTKLFIEKFKAKLVQKTPEDLTFHDCAG